MKVTIHGLDEIVANLRALPVELVGNNGGPIREAMAACAKLVRDDMRQRAPYNVEGFGKHLRDEIIMKRDPNPRASGAAERYIVTVKYREKRYANNRANRRAGKVGSTYHQYGDFYYWRFVEFGTSKMAPRAFMRSAWEANKEALPGLATTKIVEGIERIKRKMQT